MTTNTRYALAFSLKELMKEKSLEKITIQEELVFFKAAFKTQDYNSLVEYDYRYILHFYTDIIVNKTQKDLESDVTFALELYCKGSIFQTIEWVKNENRTTPTEMATLLICALPPILKDLLSEFE